MRIALLSVSIPTAGTGLWASLAPSSWYEDFPGFGRDWITAFGPYNEHLVRDFGGTLLAAGLLLTAAALAPQVPLRRAVPAAFLVFALPHLVFHLFHTGELPVGDDVVNLLLLVGSVVIPLAVLLVPGEKAPALRAPPRGPDGWRLPPARPSGPVARIAYAVSRRRYGHVLGPVAMAAHNPGVLAGYVSFELALERANRLDRRLEELAGMRSAQLTGCPFCIDFGQALVMELGITPQQVAELDRWRDSTAFSEDEQLVIEYAEAMANTPVQVSDELFDRLRARFDEAAIVELTAAIAMENYRGRFNHALGLGSEGFCSPMTNGRPAGEVLA